MKSIVIAMSLSVVFVVSAIPSNSALANIQGVNFRSIELFYNVVSNSDTAVPSTTILADSETEFSSVQGRNNWHYGYYLEPFTDPTFQPAAQFSDDKWAVQEGTYWTSVTELGGHPNGTTTSGGRTPIEQWSVRRWVSNVSGQIIVHGLLAKIGNGGDGIVGKIFVDGLEVWSQFIAGTDTIGEEYVLVLNVNYESTIDFVIAPNASDFHDQTMFTVVIRKSAPPVPGITIADSVTEFSGTQGQAWQYGYYISPFTENTFQTMNQFQIDSWFVEEGTYWTLITAFGGHPNGIMTSGDRTPVEHWSVRRWVSDTEGQISIVGSLAKSSRTCGDGIIGHVLVDGIDVWSQFIGNDDRIGADYNIDASVELGSIVDFAIEPNNSDWCDGSIFTATVREPLAHSLHLPYTSK